MYNSIYRAISQNSSKGGKLNAWVPHIFNFNMSGAVTPKLGGSKLKPAAPQLILGNIEFSMKSCDFRTSSFRVMCNANCVMLKGVKCRLQKEKG